MLIFLVIIISAVVFVGYKFLPNTAIKTIHEYYKLNQSEITVLKDGEYLKIAKAPILRDQQIYIPVDFVKTYLDKYIYWDATSNKVTVTTQNKVMHMKTDELTYYINNKPLELNFPLYRVEDVAYLPVGLLKELYAAEFTYAEKNKVLIFKLLDKTVKTSKTISSVELRYEPNIKSFVAQKLDKGANITILSQENDYVKVSTDEGLIGYLPTSTIGVTTDTQPVQKPAENRPPLKKPIDGRVVMVWDQIDAASANANPQRRVVHDGVNVLSPTWFTFDAEKLDGSIINIADKEYVNWAHTNGYQVWALISDSFNNKISHAVLKDTDTRDKVIRQLLAFVSMYDLDGINIDFEQVLKEDGENYIQFLRELAPLLREQGAYLSVDMYVPKPWTMHYNRTEVGKTADYVCVMAYDEYYSGSETSGPVASIGFVNQGVADTLLEVPAEKIVMGMPFYVRVWREEPKGNEIKLSSKAYTMDTAKSIIEREGVALKWLPEMGLNYGEYTAKENGVTVKYRIWLEDVKSIEEKLKVARDYGIAGVACWKRGFETQGVWSLIKNYMTLK